MKKKTSSPRAHCCRCTVAEWRLPTTSPNNQKNALLQGSHEEMAARPNLSRSSFASEKFLEQRLRWAAQRAKQLVDAVCIIFIHFRSQPMPTYNPNITQCRCVAGGINPTARPKATVPPDALAKSFSSPCTSCHQPEVCRRWQRSEPLNGLTFTVSSSGSCCFFPP